MERSRVEVAAATVVELVADVSTRHPEVLAATGVGDTLTFAQLWARASDLARRLVVAGVRPQDHVGLWAVQSSDLLVGIVGILRAGAAYVPLDPQLPHARLELVLRDADIATVVAPRGEAAAALGVQVVSSTPLAVAAPPDVTLPVVEPGWPAYVIYTSGSTGTPKGVVVEHRSLVAMLGWMVDVLDGGVGAQYVGTASPAFDASVGVLLFPLVTGGTLVALDAETATDPHRLAQRLREVRPQVLLTLPAMLRMLTETRWDGDAELEVWTGGERTAPDVIEYVASRVRVLRNWYGPTEATVQVTMAVLTPADTDSPIGAPAPHVTCALLDEHGTPVADGEVGELVVAGVAVARGYLHDDALTATRFTTVRTDAGDEVRAYRTGDRARRRPDGTLVLVGRIDEQLNLRGYRVEPREVEARLTAHACVREAAVVASRDADGDAQLVAYVTTDGDVDWAVLRDFVREALPSHMVPSAAVVLDALPRTASGKVDRRSLTERPAPPLARSHGAPSPATPLEARLTSFFATVLALPVDVVGVDQDFFDLGGTSLKSVRLFLLIEDELGVHLALSTLASSATPRALAAVVTAHRDGAHAHPHGGEEPRHEWERILRALWSEQLGTHRIARSTSYFELGGTEATAAAMLAELRALHLVEVAADEFAANPTIEHLAALVGRRTVRSIMVPLTTSGPGPPIFFIAGAGGLAITFLPLARLLGADQPSYGLQARGIESRAVPDLTLHQAARRYARAIREVQPHGPYLLGGHSLGGVHALQVAQRLDAMGEEVALLAIFDTPLSPSMVGRRRVRHARADVTGQLGNSPRGLPKLSTVLHLPLAGIVPLRGTEQFEAFAALGELQATFAHRLQPWAGRTTLFLSDEDEASVIEARWGHVLRGPWTSAQVPGGHIAMLERANIGVAATILRDQIARALGRRGDHGAGGPRAGA